MKKILLLNSLTLFIIFIFSVFTLWLFSSIYHSSLRFSDAAKFADVARNVYLGEGNVSDFTFFDSARLFILEGDSIKNGGILFGAVVPIYLSYYLFGVNDFSVIFPSLLSFVFISIVIYLLSKRLFTKEAALIAALSIALNLNFLDYATSGASEVLFSLQILIAYYLISLNKKKTDLASTVMFLLMYITRPQAFIFIAGGFLYLLISRFSIKKAFAIFMAVGVLAVLIDWFVLPRLSSGYIYSVTSRGLHAVYYQAAGENTSSNLRGEIAPLDGISSVFKKVFYNMYNLYKFLPRIAPWFLWPFFFFAPVVFRKNKAMMNFILVAYFTFIITILVVSLSTPLLRYIHPVVPLVYMVSIACIYALFEKFVKNKNILFSLMIVALILSTGIESFGAMILDSRAKNKTLNINRPPTYQVLSTLLQDNTESDGLVITNLDTWATWYGNRRTMWFPDSPRYILPTDDTKKPAEYVYLTNYLIDDDNYYMNDEWRSIMNLKDTDQHFFEFYEHVKTFEIDAHHVYENKVAVGVLFKKK